MNWIQTIRMALKSIGSNKVRSILTMLGIIIGVASVIAIVSSIQGTSKLQALQYEAMGSNRIDSYGYGGRGQDWDAFENFLNQDERVDAWSPQKNYYMSSNEGIHYRAKTLTNENSNTNIYFGNQNYGYVTNHTVSTGRDINQNDCKKRASVCVIGETLRRYFFGAMSPVGEKIRIGTKTVEIVGVYEGKYGGKLNTEDQLIVLPYTLQDVMTSDWFSSDKQYIIRARDGDDINGLVEDLNNMMTPILEDSSSYGYFNAYSNMQWQEQEQSSANLLALLGGGLAGISLLVGGIGIMNIMLVSVTERTREIGIRMAIGARKRDIISQFLIEAAVVSCFGGVIGIVIGCMLSIGIGNILISYLTQGNSWMPEVERFLVLPPWWLALGAFLFSALLGIIFGLYPANKASNLQPVDALRTQ